MASEPIGTIRSTMMRKATLPAGVVEAVRDRAGRLVLLEDGAMAHIERGHPEMRGRELAIATAIEVGVRCRTRVKGREKLYAPELGPGKWLAVVVAYGEERGVVITAFADKNGPRESDRI